MTEFSPMRRPPARRRPPRSSSGTSRTSTWWVDTAVPYPPQTPRGIGSSRERHSDTCLAVARLLRVFPCASAANLPTPPIVFPCAYAASLPTPPIVFPCAYAASLPTPPIVFPCAYAASLPTPAQHKNATPIQHTTHKPRRLSFLAPLRLVCQRLLTCLAPLLPICQRLVPLVVFHLSGLSMERPLKRD